jgi:hypothetical protein
MRMGWEHLNDDDDVRSSFFVTINTNAIDV